MIRNYLLILLLLPGVFHLAKAQQAQTPAPKYRFSLYGGANYAVPSSPIVLQPSFIFISADSTSVTTREAEQEVFFRFDNKYGAQLGIQLHFLLGKYLQLETGLGGQWLSYHVRREFGVTRPVPNGRINVFNFNGPSSFTDPCDETIDNTDPDFYQRDFNKKKYNIVYLQIPLQLSMGFFERRFEVQLGTYISTPIYSRVPQFASTFEQEITTTPGGETMTTCYLEQYLDNIEDGRFFTDLIWGLSGGLRYNLTKRISTELNFQVARNESVQEIYYSIHGKTTLRTYQLSMRYFLSN